MHISGSMRLNGKPVPGDPVLLLRGCRGAGQFGNRLRLWPRNVECLVSAVELADKSIDDAYRSTEIEGLEIKVERAPGTKCLRCWNWSEAVGTFADAPDICDRCHKVIRQ